MSIVARDSALRSHVLRAVDGEVRDHIRRHITLTVRDLTWTNIWVSVYGMALQGEGIEDGLWSVIWDEEL